MYRLEVKIVSRKKGQSSVASAAYRSAEKLVDERLGLTFDYTRKEKVEHTEILGFYGTREQLWNDAESAEKRKDATLAREYQFAFPRELNLEQQKDLASRFGEWLNNRYGVAVDIAIHSDKDNNNPHAHILTTTRVSNGYILTDKSWREWDYSKLKKAGKPNRKDELITVRKIFADFQNEALKEAGQLKQVSHLSYKEQGLNIKPGVHLGPEAHAMEQRGIKTEKGNHNRAIAKENKLIEIIEPQKTQDNLQDEIRIRQLAYRNRKLSARNNEHNNDQTGAIRRQSNFIRIATITQLGTPKAECTEASIAPARVEKIVNKNGSKPERENRPQGGDTTEQSPQPFRF